MPTAAAAAADAIFSSVASDIKSYSGKDPLLPWLRGVKKLRDSLPPPLLKAKLPRFLQKCAQTFESDKRYKNDPRYLRVWLQLMDYVDEPRLLLRTMEKNQIGMKRSLFYQAYALCYEKMKKYEEAEKMYHLGVQNLAEPVDELQRSYEQFLHRMQRHKNKRSQTIALGADKRTLSAAVRTDENNENVCFAKAKGKQIPDGRSENVKKPLGESNRHGPNGNSNRNGGFEVYVDSNVEVGGTKPLKKAEKKEPLQILIVDEEHQEAECCEEEDEEEDEEGSPFVFTCPQDPSASEEGGSKSPRNKLVREDTVVHRFVGSTILDEPQVENVCHHGLVDPTVNLKEAMEDINNMFGKPIEFVRAKRPKQPMRQQQEQEQRQLAGGGFFILPDDDEFDGKQSQAVKKQEQLGGGFFILPDDDAIDHKQTQKGYKRREEVGGFSILPDDDVVVDYKQNQKGKKRQEVGGFSILPDDVDVSHRQESKKPSSDARESDLFEPTMFTKQAMDDINKLFGMPLDF